MMHSEKDIRCVYSSFKKSSLERDDFLKGWMCGIRWVLNDKSKKDCPFRSQKMPDNRTCTPGNPYCSKEWNEKCWLWDYTEFEIEICRGIFDSDHCESCSQKDSCEMRENWLTEEDPIKTCDLICVDCVHTECEHYIDSSEFDRDDIDLLNTRRAP